MSIVVIKIVGSGSSRIKLKSAVMIFNSNVTEAVGVLTLLGMQMGWHDALSVMQTPVATFTNMV